MASCETVDTHVRLSNLTKYTVGGLGWLDDLGPFASVGVKIADWEMLKATKSVQLLLDNKTIKAEQNRAD